MNEIRLRLKNLRMEMLKQNLDAIYISGTDPHASEYLPDRWKIREYISGFTGSFGIIVITQEEAGLWTDTRYFLQAEDQLRGSGIKMFKLRVLHSVPPEEWLAKKLSAGSKVGIDPHSVNVVVYRNLEVILGEKGISLTKTPDLIDKIWESRPEIPGKMIFEMGISNAGLSRREKRELVIAELKKHNADIHVITTLDELAWMFNLRGSDVEYNPVFTGYGIVGKNEFILFTDKNKVPKDFFARFEKEKISILDYNDFFSYLNELKKKRIFIDPSTANYAVYEALFRGNFIVEGTSEVALLKSLKNPVELEGFREAMKKDGVALIEFLHWLKSSVGNKPVTEYTVGRKLAEFRSRQDGFQGESFPPIVGYKSHGAIVHLVVGPGDALPIEPEGVLLFDSGGQYLQGTTDITRTVALGKVSEQTKKDFTLVLKGMIALASAVFPEGTKGCNLDILARKALWDNGLNYGHGTGHGVGHFLNVHEGPMSIRQEINPVAIEPGMVLSNEPALYRQEKYGIRTENMMVCVEKNETEYGRFLGFETLTLCPIDTRLVEMDMLTAEEQNWINEYHRNVCKKLKPLLEPGLHGFLDELTVPF
jgi:Xaa-Pro aminopeptidase